MEQGEQVFTLRNYLLNPLDRHELELLIDKLGTDFGSLIRTKEKAYKDSPFNTGDKEKVVAALLANPLLMERPILSNDRLAVIARPAQKALALLNDNPI